LWFDPSLRLNFRTKSVSKEPSTKDSCSENLTGHQLAIASVSPCEHVQTVAIEQVPAVLQQHSICSSISLTDYPTRERRFAWAQTCHYPAHVPTTSWYAPFPLQALDLIRTSVSGSGGLTQRRGALCLCAFHDVDGHRR
jgi:hypothetical protein